MSDLVTRLRSFRARCWGEEGEVLDAALAEMERLRADAARLRSHAKAMHDADAEYGTGFYNNPTWQQHYAALRD